MVTERKNGRKHLSGDGLFMSTRSVFEKMPDYRQTAKIDIPMADALMAGFAMFSVKSPSLLQFEEHINIEAVAGNLKNIYKMENIPSDTQMREIIDPVDPADIRPAFNDIFRNLQRGKMLEEFTVLDGHYLVSLDGTGYFSSDKIHCNNCQEKVNQRTGQITYSHAMLGAVIVHPDKKTVIPLPPEPIIKQDGNKKNDCERNAARRWLTQFRTDHPHLKVIITEDALSPNAPHIKDLKTHNCSFILGVKPGDHGFLFREVEKVRTEGRTTELEIKQEDGTVHRFSFINDMPLNESNQDVRVNFMEYWETKPNGKKQHFSWVTDIKITKNNAYAIMRCGRARWKIENETFNTLKNKGYNFEHNFGHGHQNLSVNFALLMMLAFLVDQVQEICCPLFQKALVKKKRKSYLWDMIKSFFHMLVCKSWHMLLEGIAYGHKVLKWQITYDTS